MNKKLITLAVAAAMAAPAAAMAEATLYGRANVSVDYVDVEDFATFNQPFGGTFSLNNFMDNLAFGAVPGAFAGVGPSTVPIPLGTLGAPVGLDTGIVAVPIDAATGIPVTALAGNNAYNTELTQSGDPTIANIAAWSAYYQTLGSYATPAQIAEAQAWAKVAVAGDAIYIDPNTGLPVQITNRTTGTNQFKGWGMDQNGRASRIGVKGSEDLGSGLKAIYQIEFDVRLANDNGDSNIADGNRNNAIAMRNSFVGLAGDWGTFLVGRHDTPLKISTAKLDLFSDTLADYNFTIGFQDLRADNTVAYISPSFSGLQFAAATVPAGGATGGSGWNSNADSLGEAYSLALIYSNGPFYASVAYENLSDRLWNGSAPITTLFGTGTQDQLYQGLYDSSADDDSKLRVGLGLLDWNGFTLTGTYEARTGVMGAPEDADMDLWQIQAGYAFGNNMIKGMYGQAGVDSCADPNNVGYRFYCGLGLDFAQNHDKEAWAIGFDHNFSKRTKVYTLYTQVDDDNQDADWSGFSLGMMHSF